MEAVEICLLDSNRFHKISSEKTAKVIGEAATVRRLPRAALDIYPEPPVESLPFESLKVRVPHHDPEHGGSIFLSTLSLSMGRGSGS